MTDPSTALSLCVASLAFAISIWSIGVAIKNDAFICGLMGVAMAVLGGLIVRRVLG